MPKSKHRRKWHIKRRLRNLLASALRVKKERERLYAPFHSMVNRLTNWQRSQWAKKGYPGLGRKDAKKVEPFTKLERVRVR